MEALKQNHKKIIKLKLAKRILVGLIFVLIFDFFLFPVPVLASELEDEDLTIIEDSLEINNNLPENNDLAVARTGYYTITAYNSEVSQSDGAPCITANGFNLCEHGIEDSVAANFLKFGTKIRIPDLFGDQVFVVRDRMNKRYPDRLDVWMLDKGEAKKFGVKVAKIEILEH